MPARWYWLTGQIGARQAPDVGCAGTATRRGDDWADGEVPAIRARCAQPVGQPARGPARRAASAAAPADAPPRRSSRSAADLPDGPDRTGGLLRAGGGGARGGARGLQA